MTYRHGRFTGVFDLDISAEAASCRHGGDDVVCVGVFLVLELREVVYYTSFLVLEDIDVEIATT